MIDWAAENGINAVGMAGMLRDRHGGVETARKICAYGMDKGVRVYAIIGLFAYGGVFYEGNSPYSMSKFPRKILIALKDAMGTCSKPMRLRKHSGTRMPVAPDSRNTYSIHWIGCSNHSRTWRFKWNLATMECAMPKMQGKKRWRGN